MTALLFLTLALQDDVRQLVENLGSDSLEEREQALQRLTELGEPALPELEKAAKGSDPEVVMRAKYLLRVIPIRDRVTPHFLAAMPGVEQRLSVDDPHSWTLVLLEAMRLESVHRSERGRALFNPGDLDRVAPLGIKGAADKQEKEWACSAVVHLNLRAAETEVAKLLDEPSEELRRCALETLRQLRSPLAVIGYRRALRDPDAQIQAEACIHLTDLRDQASASEMALLLASRSAYVRGQAAWALGRLGADRYAKPVGDLLEDPDPNVRFRAVQAVGDLAARGETARVRALLRDPDPNVRAAAIRALEFVEGRTAVPAILEAKTDPIPLVQGALVETLFHLGSRENVPLALDEGPWLDWLNGIRQPEAWSRLRPLVLREPVEGTVAELRRELEKRAGMKIEWPKAVAGEEDFLSRRQRLERREPLRVLDGLRYLVPDGMGIVVEADRIRFIPGGADRLTFWKEWWAADEKRK